jgi:hypothetical protein
MADLLTSIRAEIDARLEELRPAIAEYERLSIAADALGGERRSASPPATRAARRSSATASTRARAGAKKAAPAGTARTPAKTARTPAGTARTPVRTARRARKREQPTHTPTAQAILAALEHGSHTLAELVVVTALRASDIREALRQLRTRRAIVKTERDGRSAYALPS